MFIDKLVAVTDSAKTRSAIYWLAVKFLPLTGARCATVQSITYLLAKGWPFKMIKRADVWIGTDGLSAELISRGWRKVTDLDSLKPGMICFSKDKRGRHPAPDHTYLFTGWADKAERVALIWDNLSRQIHPRNMLARGVFKGKRYSATAFDYALAPPV